MFKLVEEKKNSFNVVINRVWQDGKKKVIIKDYFNADDEKDCIMAEDLDIKNQSVLMLECHKDHDKGIFITTEYYANGAVKHTQYRNMNTTEVINHTYSDDGWLMDSSNGLYNISWDGEGKVIDFTDLSTHTQYRLDSMAKSVFENTGTVYHAMTAEEAEMIHTLYDHR